MGIPIDWPGYTEGDECELCSEVLFGDVTPKFVIAIVQDIVWCDPPFGPPPELPNGTYKLEQTAPCRWQFLRDDNVGYIWELTAGHSVFSITYPGFIFFTADIEDDCYDAFPNETVCGVGPVIGEGGYVTCWWGPGAPGL